MLLRHSFYYLFARGVPGLVNFAALALYTRLMAPEEFGRYSLVLATVGLVDVMVFQWLRLVLGRFIPAHRNQPRVVQETVLALFLALAAVVLLSAGVVALSWPDPVLRGLLAIGVSLTLVQAWLQLDLTLASAQLQPGRYGRLMGSKSVLAIIVGGWLAWLGFGAYGPLLGLIFGAVLAWLLFGLRAWSGVRPRWPESTQFRDYVTYGLPLVVTFALGWVIASSDRMIIAWLLDEAAAGIYAVGYDLPQQTLGLVLTIINTAAHPLATRRLEHEGVEAAGAQMRRNGELITTFAFTGAAALVALAPQLVDLVVGSAFRDGALAVLPWVAASAAVAGLKAFHFDIAFHLMRQSRWLVITTSLAALANVALNFLLIPSYGIVGAAWATLAAFAVACIASALLGRKIFPMPPVLPLIIKATIVAGCMYGGVAVVLSAGLAPTLEIVVGGSSGGLLAILAAICLDIGGLREGVLSRLRTRKKN